MPGWAELHTRKSTSVVSFWKQGLTWAYLAWMATATTCPILWAGGFLCASTSWLLAQNKLSLGNGALSPICINDSSTGMAWGAIFTCTFPVSISLSATAFHCHKYQRQADTAERMIPMVFKRLFKTMKNQLQQSMTLLPSKKLWFYSALSSATSC